MVPGCEVAVLSGGFDVHFNDPSSYPLSPQPWIFYASQNLMVFVFVSKLILRGKRAQVIRRRPKVDYFDHAHALTVSYLPKP